MLPVLFEFFVILRRYMACMSGQDKGRVARAHTITCWHCKMWFSAYFGSLTLARSILIAAPLVLRSATQCRDKLQDALFYNILDQEFPKYPCWYVPTGYSSMITVSSISHIKGGNGWNFGHFCQKSLFHFLEQI